MARPKLKQPMVGVSFRIPMTLRAQLDAEAFSRGIKVGDLARRALEETLSKKPKK